MILQRCVDVVVDLPTSRVDSPFTYAVGARMPVVGSHVRVPLAGRIVDGWVISEPITVPDGAALKAIESVEDDPPRFDGESVRLAAWLRRRYACTFREALWAVVGRVQPGSSPRFAFGGEPARGDRVGQALYRTFRERGFTALGAGRAARRAGVRVSARELQKELTRLVRAGVLQRLERKTRRRRMKATPRLTASARAELAATSSLEPTAQQRAAIEALEAAMRAGPSTTLLHGVTGSGKTLVYSRIIDRVRSDGGRAIVLVPEISLTPQTAARLTAAFGSRVGVLHSHLAESERAAVIAAAARGELDVIVGARSAVFARMPDLRLIVVDEEHEPSYKQDSAPRYDAPAVARERMREAGGHVILGSATPSLEAYHEARAGAIGYLRLPDRATEAPLPPVEIAAMTGERPAGGRRSLGPTLVEAMEHALAHREKTMLFVNRRGYAGLLVCRACGFIPKCRRCALSLVVHTADHSIRCHTCGAAFAMPSACPRCNSPDIRPYGFGTQRVEQEVRELFPGARIVRMDSDTTAARGAHGTLLTAFERDADVLIGTQMIAKGLDFPTVTVVGVVSADLDLHRPDFRSAERTFALLTQVAGRAGRAELGGRVVIQTYSPEHYAIQFAAQHDYDGFAERELELRRELAYPPFGRLAYLGFASTRSADAADAAARVADGLRTDSPDAIVLGPAPDPLPKARGEFRVRLAVKTPDERVLLDACASAQASKLPADVRLTIVVDPR